MDNMILLIAAAVMTGLLSLAVAIALIQNTKSAGFLVRYGTPFAAGVLLVAAFRDLLPHGVEEHGVVALNAALGAIIVFFLIEKAFSGFHHHHEEDKNGETGNKTQGWLFLVGDVFHNAIDGIALGTAFLIDVSTGMIATVALISHDIPLEVGEFGVQLRAGFTKRQIISRNVLSSFTILIGALLAFQFGHDLEIATGYLYGAIAGFFIYIALSDIVPTIHSTETKRFGPQTGFLIFGLAFGLIVASVAHTYIDVGHDHDDHNTEIHKEHSKDHDDHDDHDKDHDDEDHDDDHDEDHDDEDHDEDHDDEDHDEDHDDEDHDDDHDEDKKN
tara:strand:- start:3655 stop:4644 length:990 start_codon:yes stop_codon:yes gene_type:complete